MAEIVLYEAGCTFILKMSTEDMHRLTEISTAKNRNYYDVVLACFHAGLVALTETVNCKCTKGKTNVKKKAKSHKFKRNVTEKVKKKYSRQKAGRAKL